MVQEMQALARHTKVSLFGFEGAETFSTGFLEQESAENCGDEVSNRWLITDGTRPSRIKVFFAYFLVHKKVSWC